MKDRGKSSEVIGSIGHSGYLTKTSAEPDAAGSRTYCSACATSGQLGECPNCGTYWFMSGGKLYGILLTRTNPLPSLVVNGRTVPQAFVLTQLPNVVGPA